MGSSVRIRLATDWGPPPGAERLLCPVGVSLALAMDGVS